MGQPGRDEMEYAGILARVSDKNQEDNSSLQAQLNRCRSHCAEHGYDVCIEKTEVMSGAFVLARSVYNELLNVAAEGRLSVIVVDIPDRLGRGDAIAKLELLAQLNGARVEYAMPGRDTSTLEGLALKATDQLVSGIERLNIRRRTMGGRREWARRGRIIAGPSRPYGYNFESTFDERGHKLSCALVVVEEEAQVVRMIFTWLVHDRMTLRGITRKLTDMQIPTLKGRTMWDWHTVHGMVTNRTYMGEWRYGKRDVRRLDTPEGIRRKPVKRSENEVIMVACPAIVSRDVFQAAQEQLERNREKFRRPTRNQYLLRGRIRCKCGAAMCGKQSHKYGYYACPYASGVKARDTCNARLLRVDVAESIVWNVVCEQIKDEGRLISKAHERQKRSKDARRVIEQTIAATDVLIQKASDKLARYRELYGEGEMDKDDYLNHKHKIEVEMRKHQADQREWRDRLGEYPEVTPEFASELRRLRAEVSDRLTPDTPFEGKLRLVEMLDIRCIYNDDTHELSISGLVDMNTVSVISGYRRSAPGRC